MRLGGGQIFEDSKDFVSEGQKGSDKIIGGWREGNLCYIVVRCLVILFFVIIRKKENVFNEFVDLVNKVFECDNWFFLVVQD